MVLAIRRLCGIDTGTRSYDANRHIVAARAIGWNFPDSPARESLPKWRIQAGMPVMWATR